LAAGDFELLLFLAEEGALFDSIRLSTARIASRLNASQQTASRKLRQLAAEELVELNSTPAGSLVRLTEQGRQALKAKFGRLQLLFDRRKKGKLVGRVKIGLGEGKYYVARKPYLVQFKSLLGFTPFFGTLNLIVDLGKLRSFLAGKQPIHIKGFSTSERSFGSIRAFKVKVEGKQQAGLIFPERTTHQENEVEVIAAVNLRKKFKLREGSRVTITG